MPPALRYPEGRYVESYAKRSSGWPWNARGTFAAKKGVRVPWTNSSCPDWLATALNRSLLWGPKRPIRRRSWLPGTRSVGVALPPGPLSALWI